MKPEELVGMPCPFCGARSRVINTYHPKKELDADTITRKRRCDGEEHHEFSSVEYILPHSSIKETV